MKRQIFAICLALAGCETQVNDVALDDGIVKGIPLDEPNVSVQLVYRRDVIEIPKAGKVKEFDGNCKIAKYSEHGYDDIKGGEIVDHGTVMMVGKGCYLYIDFGDNQFIEFNKAPDSRDVVFER